MRLLTRREHSKSELRKKLYKRGFKRTDIDPVIEELETLGVQSDYRFTQQYFFNRVEKGFGPVRIEQELIERGIREPLVDELITVREGGWDKVIQDLYTKKYAGATPATKALFLKRLRYLNQRGFRSDQISKLISKINKRNSNSVR